MGPMAQTGDVGHTPRVAYTLWETSRIPRAFARCLDGAAQVWVPTDWGAELLARNGIDRDRLRIVPCGVDSRLFQPAGQPAAGRRNRRFRFLCVGKWEQRKGCSDLLEAFCRAFSAADAVELVMHCQNPANPGFDLERTLRRTIARLAPRPPRVLASTPVDRAGLVDLYRSADAFVLPTRGEGWGLPVLEAMACGLPCLVTDHGALRTFCPKEHTYWIPVRKKIRVADPTYFDPAFDWGYWDQPDLDHLVELLRHVARRRWEARRKGAAARQTARRWTWERAAAAAVTHLGEIRRPPAVPGEVQR